MRQVTVLYFEIGKEPVPVTVDDKLEEYQKLVGGDIETCGLFNGVTVVCNEEGKVRRMPVNCVFQIRGSSHHELIVGNFFVTRINREGEFADMNETQIAAVKRMAVRI